MEMPREYYEMLALLENAEVCRSCGLPIMALAQLCPARTPDYPLCIPANKNGSERDALSQSV